MSTTDNKSAKQFALFEKGFRCFFLGAALLATSSIVIWFSFLTGSVSQIFRYYPPLIWHMHEMIFGYTGAVIAGFLLTAASNWTGLETLRGKPLICLFVVWLAAHILPLAVITPGWLIAILNVGLFMVLAVAIAIPIVASGNTRNLFVVGILIILAICNALVHAQLLGVGEQVAHIALSVALYLQLLLIIIIAGRIFPMFSAGGVAIAYQPIQKKWLEVASIVSFILFALGELISLPALPQLGLALLAVCFNSLRLVGWFNWQILTVPLVWVLHVGYYFLIIGILLTGLSGYYPQTQTPGLHAMLIGGLGLITIGMMARVSLGHTGRNIHQPPRGMSIIFIGIIFAVFFRVLVPLAFPEYYLLAIKISGLSWALTFFAFTILFAPYLIKPRVDGEPG